jgi:hypothetical protein
LVRCQLLQLLSRAKSAWTQQRESPCLARWLLAAPHQGDPSCSLPDHLRPQPRLTANENLGQNQLWTKKRLEELCRCFQVDGENKRLWKAFPSPIITTGAALLPLCSCFGIRGKGRRRTQTRQTVLVPTLDKRAALLFVTAFTIQQPMHDLSE